MDEIGRIVAFETFIVFENIGFALFGVLDGFAVDEIIGVFAAVVHDQVEMLACELIGKGCFVLAQADEFAFFFCHFGASLIIYIWFVYSPLGCSQRMLGIASRQAQS